MNDEYLPNGRPQKAFSIAPAPEDFAPFNARDEVLLNTDLDLGARLMFVRILDLSTRENTRLRYGSVTISQTKLADNLGVSIRTIWNWKRQLLATGVLWMTSQPMPNAWPVDTYHVTALDHPSRSDGKTTAEGMWGNGHKHPAAPRGSGFRGNPLHAEGAEAKSAGNRVNAALSGNPLPLSVATCFDSESQPVAGGSSNPVLRGVETGCEPERQPVAGGSGNPLPRGVETGCEHRKAIGTSQRAKSGGGNAAPQISDEEKAFKEWKQSLVGWFPSRLEKLAEKLRRDRKQCRTREAQAFIERKLSCLTEILEGPQPEWTDPKPTLKPVKAAKPVNVAALAVQGKQLAAAMRAAIV